MRRTVLGSVTKFCPRARLGRRWCRSRRSSTSPRVRVTPSFHQLMVTCTTPWLSGASFSNTSFARSMIMPSAYGPRSLTVHCAVAPFDALTVTTVPMGNVLWAHVPGGAASYHVAPPLCVRPDGAADPDDPVPDFGVGLAGAAAGFGAAFTGVVVRRGTVVDGAARRVVARVAVTAVVDVGGATVVGGAVGGGVDARLTPPSTR